MPLGKAILTAVLAAALCQFRLSAGDAPPVPEAVSLLSVRHNAAITIGGEVHVDYSFRTSRDDSAPAGAKKRDLREGDLAVRYANLRLVAEASPNLKASIKIDLSSARDAHGDPDEILEEAMLVMSAVGGTGLGFFAGKGRAPYGQDITLGMIQSYHHDANRAASSEGRIFVSEPSDIRNPSFAGDVASPMRPGQFGRSVVAGASYDCGDMWRFEVAAFRPHRDTYDVRLSTDRSKDAGADIGGAARVWWRPFEELVVQGSFLLARSNDMGRTRLRLDVLPGARGTDMAKAASVGFDYRRGAWRVFGEYQHGWDWNFTKGYDTDTWQLGVARLFGEGWRAGGMIEGLHIRDKAAETRKDTYYRVVLNARREFANGFFLLGEYAHEWRRTSWSHQPTVRTRGHFVGIRAGMSF